MGGGHTPPQVVLDMPRSVCLLRSRRRTFLFTLISSNVEGTCIFPNLGNTSAHRAQIQGCGTREPSLRSHFKFV